MFIKIAKLEAVLKKAYKGAGIHFERYGSRIILATGNLYIEADVERVTFDFKAAVVKYLGEFPREDMAATVCEDAFQQNIGGSYDRKLIERDTSYNLKYIETPFTYQGDIVYQGGGTLITVPIKEYLVFDIGCVDEQEEIPDAEWECADDIIINRNDTMVMGLRYQQADEILERIQTMPLT